MAKRHNMQTEDRKKELEADTKVKKESWELGAEVKQKERTKDQWRDKTIAVGQETVYGVETSPNKEIKKSRGEEKTEKVLRFCTT